MERLAGAVGSIGRIARTVSMISGLVNSEVKYVDTSLAGTLLDTGAYQVALTSIAQGDDYNQRGGRTVLSKSLDVRFSVAVNQLNTQLQNIGWAIVLDRRPDEATTCTWATVFDSLNIWSHVDRANHAGRFVILARGALTLSGDQHPIVHIKRFINLKGIHLKFDGTAATNYDQNQIFLIGMSDQTSSQPTTAGESRFSYYDN